MFLLNRPKLLITGGSGFIGGALVNSLRRHYPVHFTYNEHEIQFSGAFGHRLDIKNIMRMDEVLTEVRPKVLVHTAALTNVAQCEEDWTETYDVNVRAVSELLTHCRRFDTKIVLFSTDLIFDGKRGNYEENDDAFPVSRYGKSKRLAEQIVLDAKYLRPLVLRISLTLGRSPSSNQGMVGWLKGCLDKGEPVTLFTDEYRTPIYLPDLVAIIDEALRKDMEGVFHVASHPRISRYDLGVLFADAFGYDKSLIVAGSLNDYQGTRRAPDVSLNTRKMLDKFEYRPFGVEQALKSLKGEYDGEPPDESVQNRRSNLYWRTPPRSPER